MECIYFWLDTFNDLQVTQPPFFHVFLFVITEPFTNRVEREYNADPNKIHCEKQITFTGGNELCSHYLRIRFQAFCIRMSPGQKTNCRNKMDQKEMENIIKKGYTPIHGNESREPIFLGPTSARNNIPIRR